MGRREGTQHWIQWRKRRLPAGMEFAWVELLPTCWHVDRDRCGCLKTIGLTARARARLTRSVTRWCVPGRRVLLPIRGRKKIVQWGRLSLVYRKYNLTRKGRDRQHRYESTVSAAARRF